jgi:hypothetical protein
MTTAIRLTTAQQEALQREVRTAAINATWDAVQRAVEPFSYRDVWFMVKDAMSSYGQRLLWGLGPVVETEMRDMAKAGLIVAVRAFDPPNKPHLFVRAGESE